MDRVTLERVLVERIYAGQMSMHSYLFIAIVLPIRLFIAFRRKKETAGCVNFNTGTSVGP